MKKGVECLCVVASAVDSEAHALLTALRRLGGGSRRKGLVLGEGFYFPCKSCLAEGTRPIKCFGGTSCGGQDWGGERRSSALQQLSPRSRGLGAGGTSGSALIRQSSAGGKEGRRRRQQLV